MSDKHEIVKLDEEKVNGISLLSNEQKNNVMNALPFTSIPYFPISKDFIQTYILNDNEYPSIEGKLSQAATEMKGRFNRLIDANFDYEQKKIELEEIELDIKEIEENREISEKRKELSLRKKDLELKLKQYQIASLKASVEDTYREFMNWSNTVQEYFNVIKNEHPELNNHNDIPYEKIRDLEMKVKINRWKQLALMGQELTPSQKVLFSPEELLQIQFQNALRELGNDTKKEKTPEE